MAYKAKVGVILDKRKLDEIAATFNVEAGKIVQKLAQDCTTYAKSHMSSQSPSDPGQPPGIDTSTLVNSIEADEVPGTNGLVWAMNIGAHYGVDLEYGTMHMAARPFVAPAVIWIANNIPRGLLKRVVGDK